MSRIGTVGKVLMVVENRPAPADARVWPEAVALRDHGLQVSIISPKGVQEYQEDYICLDGIQIYRYQLPTGDTPAAYIAEYAVSVFKTFWLSLKVWRRHGFDVIHAANPPDTFFALGTFYRLFGKKFVFDQHDLTPEMFEVLFQARLGAAAPLCHRVLRIFEWCSYRVAHLVIVTNESFERIAVQRGGCAPPKLAVVRNGPDLTQMQPSQPEPALKMGREHLLAYVGVMGPQDGVEYALQAMHTLVHIRGRRDVSLVLLGDGSHTPALRALAHELQLDDCVHFTGWTTRAQIARYLSAADIGLSPEPQNALNDASTMVKTMEYMALGIPVVAFELTETRFTAQEAGLYARPNLVDDYADKIEALLDDAPRRGRMGTLGRRRVEEALSWEHSRQHLLFVYDQLLRHGREPAGNQAVTAPVTPAATLEHSSLS